MKIKKCIIPIAGKGTRFLPITKTVSKEMLPIINDPTILLLAKECLLSGIEEIIFVVGNHNYELVKNFFSENVELNEFLKNDSKKELLNDINEIISKIKIHYVFQDENIRGTAGALYAAKDLFEEDEYFGVMFGDDLFYSDYPALKQLIDEAEENHCNVAGVGEVEKELIPNYGIIRFSHDNVVDGIVEKPAIEEAPSNLAIRGRYILHSTFFANVLKNEKHNNNEYFLPDVLMSLNEPIRAVNIKGNYFDIGSHSGFIEANVFYGLKDNKINEELKKFISKVGE